MIHSTCTICDNRMFYHRRVSNKYACHRIVHLVKRGPVLQLQRGLHQSFALSKKVTDDESLDQSKLSKSSEGKEKLLEAAAEVAASMKGSIEDDVFNDLAAQISKLDASPSPSTPSKGSAAFVKDKKTVHSASVKKRIDQILDKYAADAKAKLRRPPIGASQHLKVDILETLGSHKVKAGKAERAIPRGVKNIDKAATSDDSLKTVPSSIPKVDIVQLAKKVKQSLSVKAEKAKLDAATHEPQAASTKPLSYIDSLLLNKDNLENFKMKGYEYGDSTASKRNRERDGKRKHDGGHKTRQREHRQDVDHEAPRRSGVSEKPKKSTRPPRRIMDQINIYSEGKMRGDHLLEDVEPLNIFNPEKWTKSNVGEPIPMLKSWTNQFDKQLKDAKFIPSNRFEEMIQWTDEGKLWQYPIDNEQGMQDEQSVPFYEHVFLEKHLKPFPSSGPIRTFMEQVILGLSKNPHLTVEEKQGHIQWYEDYFREKQSVVSSEPLLANTSAV